MRIGIVGNGIVGNATAQAFIDHVDDVLCYDIDPLRCGARLGEVMACCDLIFVCLPTPPKSNYSLECDTHYLDEFFASLGGVARASCNFVLRSTVPIGYTRKARVKFNLPNLVHSPEFLTARTAVEDAKNPTRLVIGHPIARHSYLQKTCGALHRLYKERWPTVFTREMTSDESEAVKLFQNGFSAVKIAYFNEIRSLADKIGLDWQTCIDTLLAGGWINPMHTQVPGPDGKRGFGGSCLPKDLANLVACMESAGLPSFVGPRDDIEALSVCRTALFRNRFVDRVPVECEHADIR